jgi:hypothetical protein
MAPSGGGAGKAVVAAWLLAFAPVAPASKLAVAINYAYHRVMPGIASDGSD